MVEDVRVIRRSACLATVCLGVVGLLAPAAWAAGGAEFATLQISPQFGVRAATFDLAGTNLATVLPPVGQRLPQPFILSPPSWTGDGAFLVVSAQAQPPRKSEPESGLRVFVVPGDGGPPTAISGTEGGLFPLGFPDGQTVAFLRARGSNSGAVSVEAGSGKKVIHRTRARFSVWLARLDGGAPVRLTPWRTNGYDVPTSVSPDGSTLAFTKVTIDRSKRKPRSTSEARLLDLGTGRSVPVGPNISAAAFSPDGTRLAVVVNHRFPRPHLRKTKHGMATLFGETDIYVKDLITGALTQVTSGPGLDVDPAWDPSGQRLAFIRLRDVPGLEAALLGLGDSVYEVNADGSCLTRELHEAHGGFSAPAWRPGPERAAGPITC